MRRKHWLQLAAAVGIAILLGVTFSVQNYIMMNSRGYTISWHDSWSEQVPFWVVWAMLSPIFFYMTSRFPLDRERWWRTILMHIPAGIVFTLVHFGIYFAVLVLLQERDAKSVKTLAQFSELLPRLNFGLRFWSYLLLISIGYAIDFYQRYQENAMRASQLETRLAQAELDALKMQLHPHFLFNTLNSISALLHKDVEAADRMIARLGDFLRMTLRNSGRQEISFAEELDFLKCYLEIERIRFHDRLTVEINIEPGAESRQVPNLLLQPIVENAIRHGIGDREAPGKISIHAACSNGALRIRVQDNGAGLKPDGVRYREGVGLQNTRSRLQQLYGARQRLEMYNSPGGGVTVEIEMPQRGPHQANNP
jgi:sensor histidine kinase YesM